MPAAEPVSIRQATYELLYAGSEHADRTPDAVVVSGLPSVATIGGRARARCGAAAKLRNHRRVAREECS
jgi:hypothetical protein